MDATADLLFTGGPVLCMDGARTRASALAVRGGRIAAVGHDVGDLVGPRTEVVDLAGRPLLPGFQDAHVHAVMGGVELGQCDLAGTVDRASTCGGSAPTRTPTRAGSGSSAAAGRWRAFRAAYRPRTCSTPSCADRPVFLFNRDHHGAWVNSRALERAGIDRDTPDPADGVVNRDADGRPAGCLQEGAVALVAGCCPR